MSAKSLPPRLRGQVSAIRLFLIYKLMSDADLKEHISRARRDTAQQPAHKRLQWLYSAASARRTL